MFYFFVFFFNDTATTEIYTLSLHDALPILAAGGGGLAHHAEYVDVPVNLVVKIPGDLSYREASTVTLGAIAMHGIRRANLSMGEFCVVFGVGILGLLALQMLKASGIRVLAVDIDQTRLNIAHKLGAEFIIHAEEKDPVKTILNITNGYGTDAVLFTASTSSSIPLSQSFQMSRKKGRVILLGVSGMEINRKDIFQKEIDFMISTSYGPGRYDESYETKGIDYPYHYVRWTENRNFSEYLRLVNNQIIDLIPLISKVYLNDQAAEAFNTLKTGSPKPLMVLLDYGIPDESALTVYREQERKIMLNIAPVKEGLVHVALIGAGSFATHMHLPNLTKLVSKYELTAVVDKKGYQAKSIGEQYGAKYSTTNIDEVLEDPNIDLVIIITRHDNHGELVLKSLEKGKHVFVEKPIALKTSDAREISKLANKSKLTVMVGHLLLYHPAVKLLKKIVDSGELGKILYIYSTRVNLGQIRLEENAMWSLAPHDVSVAMYLLGDTPVSVTTRGKSYLQKNIEDVIFMSLSFKKNIFLVYA